MPGCPKFWVIISPCSVTRKCPFKVPLGCAMIAWCENTCGFEDISTRKMAIDQGKAGRGPTKLTCNEAPSSCEHEPRSLRNKADVESGA